jgi:hypothetical protein
MLTKQAMEEMVKEAGTVVHSCGHTAKCRCKSEHVTHYDTPCFDCRQKQAEEQIPNPPAGKAVVEAAKKIGNKAVMGGALVAGGVQALGKPVPPHKINDRY